MFVEIGLVPNSDFVKDLVTAQRVRPRGGGSQDPADILPGIWAAGDVSDVLYDQNNISVGDAIKAALNIYDKIKKG